MTLRKKFFENILEKEENAGNQRFEAFFVYQILKQIWIICLQALPGPWNSATKKKHMELWPGGNLAVVRHLDLLTHNGNF